MDADSWCQEVAQSYFSCCVDEGELMSDSERDRWIDETVDGASLGDLDDTSLIELADDGLNDHGKWSMSREDGVREALNTLALGALTTRIHGIVQSTVDEHDLDICDAISDSPPDDERNGHEYKGETHLEDLMVWYIAGKREVWKYIDEFGLWAEFTSVCPPTSIEEMKNAIEEEGLD